MNLFGGPCDILNRTHFVRFEIINDIFDLDIKSWMTFHQIWRPSCSGLEFAGSQSGLTRQIYPLALVPGQIYPPWPDALVPGHRLTWFSFFGWTFLDTPTTFDLVPNLLIYHIEIFLGPFSNFFEHTYKSFDFGGRTKDFLLQNLTKPYICVLVTFHL